MDMTCSAVKSLLGGIAVFLFVHGGAWSAAITGYEFDRVIASDSLTINLTPNSTRMNSDRKTGDTDMRAENDCLNLVVPRGVFSTTQDLQKRARPCAVPSVAGFSDVADTYPSAWKSTPADQSMVEPGDDPSTLVLRIVGRGSQPSRRSDYAIVLSPQFVMFGAGLLGLAFLMRNRRRRRGQLGLEV